jgi:hypothetical protein
MSFTNEQFQALLRKPAIARRNPAGGEAQSPVPERPVRHEPLGQEEGKDGDTGRYAVRIVSRRGRLLDPDNLCPKYFIDGLRYAGFIPDDRPDVIGLAVSQEKTAQKEEQATIIEIERIA